MKTLLHLFIAAVVLTPAIAAVDAGNPAPDFTLTDSQGKEHKLSDFKGKYVVLEWANPECPFVRKHYDSGNMQKLQKEYTGKGVVWLMIASSAEGKQGHFTAEKWNETLKQENASPTAVLLDADGQVGKLYGAKTSPHMFVINPEGNVVYAGAIDSIKSANKADIEKATNYVSAALDAAMAGKPVETASASPYGCSIKY